MCLRARRVETIVSVCIQAEMLTIASAFFCARLGLVRMYMYVCMYVCMYAP